MKVNLFTILYTVMLFYLIIEVERSCASFLSKLFRIKSINLTDPSSKRDVTGMIDRRIKPLKCTLPPCNEDKFMIFLAELQTINPESIVNLSTNTILIKVCRDISASLDSLDQYLRTCEVRQNNTLYVKLIRGVDRLYCQICRTASPMKREFVFHSDCLQDLHDDFENCYGPPDWTEIGSKRDICSAYKDIADCYYLLAAETCGKNAAKVMKLVARGVIDAVLGGMHCPSVAINPTIGNLFHPNKDKTECETKKPICKSQSEAERKNTFINLVYLIIILYINKLF